MTACVIFVKAYYSEYIIHDIEGTYVASYVMQKCMYIPIAI